MVTTETENIPTIVFQPTRWDKMRLSFVSLLKKINKKLEYVPYINRDISSGMVICQECMRGMFGISTKATYRDPCVYYCYKCAVNIYGERRMKFARWIYTFGTKLRKKIYTDDKFVEENN